MWILELSLAMLWMFGILLSGLHGPWHLIALAVVALVIAEGTSVERRLVSLLHVRKLTSAPPPARTT